MPEEIHEDIHHHSDGASMGLVLGIVVLVLALVLIFYFLLPLTRGTGTQFNIPGRIDVNLHQIR